MSKNQNRAIAAVLITVGCLACAALLQLLTTQFASDWPGLMALLVFVWIGAWFGSLPFIVNGDSNAE